MSRDELVFVACAAWSTLMLGLTLLFHCRARDARDDAVCAAVAAREYRDQARRHAAECGAEPDVIPLPRTVAEWSDPDWEVDPESRPGRAAGGPAHPVLNPPAAGRATSTE